MAGGQVQLRSLTKRFDEHLAVDSIDALINAGEFFSLLGPSGCGKTTTLRMIAGFERPTDGEILLDGEDVANTPPHERNVHTVFQNYALFPHLNVYDNIAFGLRRHKVAKDEIRQRVEERSASSSSTGSAAAGRASSPAASSSGSRSPARSFCAPRCCCSTSRSARSTPRSASSSGSS